MGYLSQTFLNSQIAKYRSFIAPISVVQSIYNYTEHGYTTTVLCSTLQKDYVAAR